MTKLEFITSFFVVFVLTDPNTVAGMIGVILGYLIVAIPVHYYLKTNKER